jgi:hypothetical protein
VRVRKKADVAGESEAMHWHQPYMIGNNTPDFGTYMLFLEVIY